MTSRKILHVDMDAFYTSVEQRDNPGLRGQPVVVGGNPQGRGVVAAASYEARRFGVHSAMPAAKALRACPSLIFLPPRMDYYKAVSRELHAIFREVSALVEPLALDEAYLDVTQNRLGETLAGRVAQWVKQEIRSRLDLTASAGGGPNKFVAKIASDLHKPDGLTLVPPDRVLDFLAPLPVSRLWGVGPATTRRLLELGLRTIGDVRTTDPDLLKRRFGKQGQVMRRLAWGEDSRVVTPHRPAKSRGSERTFSDDIRHIPRMLNVLQEQTVALCAQLEAMGVRAGTITLKVRYSDFTTITRSHSFPTPGRDAKELYETLRRLLLHETAVHRRPVRLLGVSASNFVGDAEPEQLILPLETEP